MSGAQPNFAAMSVRELKTHLSEAGIDFSGAFEKSELVALAEGKLSSPEKPAGVAGVDGFLKDMLGAGSALSAEYELRLSELSVAQLKAHLRKRGIDVPSGGAVERSELIALALEGPPGSKSNTAVGLAELEQEMGEHLLEC